MEIESSVKNRISDKTNYNRIGDGERKRMSYVLYRKKEIKLDRTKT